MTKYMTLYFKDAKAINNDQLNINSKSKNALVIWRSSGSLGFNIGYIISNYNKLLRSMFKLPSYYFSIYVGLILGDAYFLNNKIKNNKIGNVGLALEMTISSLSFILYTFFILAPFCSSFPRLRFRKRKETNLTSIFIFTRALPCFNDIWNLFHTTEIKTKHIKPELYYFFRWNSFILMNLLWWNKTWFRFSFVY